MNQRIAARLVEYRQSAGLSQEKLAEQLNVSRQAVSKWERGESLPDIGNIMALADLYGVTVDELLRGKVARGQEGGGNEIGTRVVDALDVGRSNAQNDSRDDAGYATEAAVVESAAPNAREAETPNESESAESFEETRAGSPREDEGVSLDDVADASELKQEKEKPPCRKRRTWPKVAAATLGALLVATLIGAMAYLVPAVSSTEHPFAEEMAEYKPSVGFPWDKLSDEDYTAEGEGGCTVSGYISALYLDWPEGKVSIRTVDNQETQGAMVIRDKTSGSGTTVRWRQEGGQLVVFQERDESGLPVAASLPEVLKPEVEILVPKTINLLDLLQMRVENGTVDVGGFHLVQLKLQQDSGNVILSQNDAMQSNVEVNGGTLSMKGSVSRSMDLLQRGGASTVSFQGTAPPTMDVVVEGGDAAVWLGADEGCQVRLDQSGEGVFDFAFDTATQSGDIYNAGNMETFIGAKLSGGTLSIGTRGIRGISEL